ncbi:hypothetical protein [Rosettibacter firmus]|uniref:hypothetical protein n=1 Tax=Rosettibacter firmus TaxID=3111522 RepID=UPI00336BB3FA
MNTNTITLYPSNWLYNAGVIGIASYYPDYISFENCMICIDKNLFTNISFDNYFEKNKVINLTGNNLYYPNFIDSKGNQKNIFSEFITRFNYLENSGCCHICANPYYLNDEKYFEIEKMGNAAKMFLNKIKYFDMYFNKLLGPSKSKFPNGFWNMNESLEVCHLCSFILIHHHLAFTNLSDKTQLFINAPSFKLMYELNRIVKALYQSEPNDAPKKRREIVANSIIEYAHKISFTFSKWTSMNIEIISKKSDDINYYTFPYNVAVIISDRDIANLLRDIGETNILTIILEQRYNELIDIAHKIFRVCLKNPEKFLKNDRNILRDFIKIERNLNRPLEFANKLLKLYSIIVEKLKGVGV